MAKKCIKCNKLKPCVFPKWASNSVGNTFGKLKVIVELGISPTGSYYVECICECGKVCVKGIEVLKSGKTISCGCAQRNACSISNRTHGESKSKLYSTWCGIKKRCYQETAKSYPDYGGRGIKMCTEWDDYMNFKKWALEFGYNEALTIDRVDVNGDYSPNNCRWATRMQQANNTRKNTHIEIDGRLYTTSEVCRIYKIKYGTIKRRLELNWSNKDLLNPVLRNRYSKNKTPHQ